MRSARRLRLASAVLVATASVGVYAAGSAAGAGTPSPGEPGNAGHGGPPVTAPSVTRFDLNGYVIDTDYSLGRNKGNTFRQTYKTATVQGVPIKGPSVGTKFPPEDYVAMPIGNHELYVAWLDPKTHALVDVFVMDFATHALFDYAPGSAHPESSGAVKIVKRGKQPQP
jgi:hypothetical protein